MNKFWITVHSCWVWMGAFGPSFIETICLALYSAFTNVQILKLVHPCNLLQEWFIQARQLWVMDIQEVQLVQNLSEGCLEGFIVWRPFIYSANYMHTCTLKLFKTSMFWILIGVNHYSVWYNYKVWMRLIFLHAYFVDFQYLLCATINRRFFLFLTFLWYMYSLLLQFGN